jgi:hypothetical protein
MSSAQLTGVGSYLKVEGVTVLYFNITTDNNETYAWSDLAVVTEGTTFQQYIEANKSAYLVDIENQITAWTACEGKVTIKDMNDEDVVITLTKEQYLKPTLPTYKTLLERVKDIEELLS